MLLLENDLDTDEVKLTLFVPQGAGEQKTHEGEQKSKQKTSESKQKSKQKTDSLVLDCIRENPSISRSELAAINGKSESAIYKVITKLKNAGRIHRIGGDKGGHWEITE